MKNLIKSYWPVLYAVLISIYEAYSFISESEFIPVWFKAIAGILAFVGFAAKNYKTPEKS